MSYSIYILKDPRSNKVRYVGLSKDVQKRFKQHIQRGHTIPWIQELLEQEIEPILQIIETNIPDLATARSREQHWIWHYEGQGHALENWAKNEAAHRERAERADLYQRVYSEFITEHPHEIAEELTRMTIAGYNTVGYCAWDDKYRAVVGTVKLLEEKPGFGLHLTSIDVAELTFNLFGYTWKESEAEQ